jgi:hypothetical protein
MSIPAIFPLAETSGTGNYPVIVVDEGTFVLSNYYGFVDTASLAVRIENLPDTLEAVTLAVEAAKLAYPTHPDHPCLVLVDAGPIFGTRVSKGNSMFVGRNISTEPGTPAIIVNVDDQTTTSGYAGTVGSVALVRLNYKLPPYVETI